MILPLNCFSSKILSGQREKINVSWMLFIIPKIKTSQFFKGKQSFSRCLALKKFLMWDSLRGNYFE